MLMYTKKKNLVVEYFKILRYIICYLYLIKQSKLLKYKSVYYTYFKHS